MDATTPPSNIHIALSVGEPVKKREMSELNDVVARRSDPAAPICFARISFDIGTTNRSGAHLLLPSSTIAWQCQPVDCCMDCRTLGHDQ
jgi:hypothetical protein